MEGCRLEVGEIVNLEEVRTILILLKRIMKEKMLVRRLLAL